MAGDTPPQGSLVGGDCAFFGSGCLFFLTRDLPCVPLSKGMITGKPCSVYSLPYFMPTTVSDKVFQDRALNLITFSQGVLKTSFSDWSQKDCFFSWFAPASECRCLPPPLQPVGQNFPAPCTVKWVGRGYPTPAPTFLGGGTLAR